MKKKKKPSKNMKSLHIIPLGLWLPDITFLHRKRILFCSLFFMRKRNIRKPQS